MQRRNSIFHYPLNFWLAVLLLALGSLRCAGLKTLAQPVPPKVTFRSLDVGSLSFTGLDLVCRLAIENPNPIGVSLAGFSYELVLGSVPFVHGEQDRKQRIAARESSLLDVPVSLQFGNLLDTVQHLRTADSADYRLNVSCSFDVPLLGAIKVPISRSGRLPVLRMPRVQLASIRVTSIGVTRAHLEVQLDIDNPNSISALFERLEYTLALNGQQVAQGTTEQPITLKAWGSNRIILPLQIDFMRSGRTLAQFVNSREPIDYSLDGRVVIMTSLQHFVRLPLAFQHAGTISLQ